MKQLCSISHHRHLQLFLTSCACGVHSELLLFINLHSWKNLKSGLNHEDEMFSDLVCHRGWKGFLLPFRLSTATLLRSRGAATPTVKGLLAIGSPPNFTTMVISPCRHRNLYCVQTTGPEAGEGVHANTNSISTVSSGAYVRFDQGSFRERG